MQPTKRLKSQSRPSATMNSEFVTQSKMAIKNIELPLDKITEFCKRWKIQELASLAKLLYLRLYAGGVF